MASGTWVSSAGSVCSNATSRRPSSSGATITAGRAGRSASSRFDGIGYKSYKDYMPRSSKAQHEKMSKAGMISTTEAAKLVGVAPETVWRWVTNGVVEGVQ